jgi:hypothetical protein
MLDVLAKLMKSSMPDFRNVLLQLACGEQPDRTNSGYEPPTSLVFFVSTNTRMITLQNDS